MARPIRLSLLVAACLLAATGCAPLSDGEGADQPRVGRHSPQLEPDPQTTTAVAALEGIPWGMDFLPDGTALLTQRNKPQVVRADPQHPGRAQEVGSIPDVDFSGDGGVLGIAVSLNFYEMHYIFVYYTTARDNRVVRYSYFANRMGAPEPIVTGIPKGPIHNGGALLIGGPGNDLFIGTGDGGNKALAQDEKSLGGKVLHVDVDGHPAGGAPWGSRVWSKGHANVVALSRASDLHIFSAEPAAQSADEINRIEAGGNYGWPLVEGSISGRESLDPRLKGLMEPRIVFSGPGECQPRGLAFDVIDRLYVACAKSQQIYRAGPPIPPAMRGVMTGVRLGPHDRLWATAQDGRVVILPVQR